MKRNITIVCLSLLLIFSIVFHIFQYEDKKFVQDRVDAVFVQHFSSLCSNLRVDEETMGSSQWNQQNEIYAHTAFTVFSSTSYAEDTSLNGILVALHGYCQNGTLKDHISFDLAEELNRLAHDLENQDLSKQIYQQYFVLQ